MKAKKEYAILIVIIVALGLYLVFRNPDRTQYELPQLSHVETAEITKIEVFKGDRSIALKKEGDDWHIQPEGYPADGDKVNKMLEAVDQLAVTALVSESKSYGLYDLDGDKKITVKAWSGDKLQREFDLGKAASSFRHTFVRLAGDDRVYHGLGNFRGKFDQTIDNLRNKTVLSFDQDEIEGIRLTQEKEDVTFVRTQLPVEVSTDQDEAAAESVQQPAVEMIWQTADGKTGDEAKLKGLFSTLSRLRCETYIDDKTKEDFKEPIYAIELQGAQAYTLSIFAKMDEEAKSYPSVSSINDYPFLLSERQAENLMKKYDELLKAPDESSTKQSGE